MSYPFTLRLCRLLAVAAGAAILAGSVLADDKSKQKEDPEVRLGRENAAENDKQVKFVTDSAIIDRVNRIGQEIAAVANTTPTPALFGSPEVKKFNYTFKVVDDKDVNAYSLPGGFIYVNKGLLDYIHSDDELAGVLAHEVSHAAHHHMMKLVKEQNKIQGPMIGALIAAILLGKGGGGASVGNVMLAGQLYMTAKLNTYGIEAEKDADQSGIRYLTKTKYSPVGMLTFMERLARDEQNGPIREMGIFRTHPPSPDRARAALAELEQLGIPANRRAADPTMRATFTMVNMKDSPAAEVKMYKTVVARLVASDGQTAEQRGKKLADSLNRLFDDGLQMFEVKVSPDGSRVVARYDTLIAFTPADASAQGNEIPKLAQSALEAVKQLLWQEQLNRPSASSGF